MATATHTTIGGVFDTRDRAIRAVDELQRAGFENDQIGIIGRDADTGKVHKENAGETEAEEGGLAGAVIGAGAGALVGLGVISGVIPVIGPAIAAGTLGTILSNALAGAAVAGLTGALIGMGIPEADAEYYESELKAGRTLVTVQADERAAEARRILDANGARTKRVSDKKRP
jgi:hypothetical protein